jgi:subtilisin family serine protease
MPKPALLLASLASVMLVCAAPVSSALLGGVLAEPKEYLLGYAPGQKSLVVPTVEKLGAKVVGGDDALGVLVVQTRDAASLLALVGGLLDFAEPQGTARAAGAQWNGAQWNGAQWNGVQWNGVQWNGAQWNGAQWNGNAYEAPADPGRHFQWGLDEVRAPDAWEKERGSGAATLCVVDSGIDPQHPDLRENVRLAADGGYGWDLLGSDAQPFDDAGHGTHVAGVAAARHSNGFGVAGVSNSDIVAAKVLDANGRGKTSDVAFGIRWCADQDAEVVLLALAVDGRPKTVDRALEYADERGVTLVASAGNGGPCRSCVAYPASDARVLAVAASGPDAMASFSSTGSQVDVVAPGVDIASTFPGEAFAYGSGTSQAAAFAAGVALLVLEHEPALSPAEVRERLAQTARVGEIAGAPAGLLDAEAALEG